MSGEQHDGDSKLTPTRRHALQLAAGTATAVTFATTPARAQEDDILRDQTQEDQVQPQDQDRVQWSFPTGGDVNPSPTVVNNTVFVGSFDTNLYAVDANTGDQQWSFRTEDRIASSPTVADGTVFVGSYDTNLYAVDTATGDEQWVFQTGERIASSPTVANGTVFFGSEDNNLYAVDADTGDQQWVFETGSAIWLSSPTIIDSTVFIGSLDGNLYAVDADTGTQQWVFQTGGRVVSSPTVADGTVFVGSEDTNLYALDADTGDQQWLFETGGGVNSSPTVVNDTVFVGSFDTKLYAVNVNTGNQRWSVSTANGIYSSPTVVDGTIFIGSDVNSLYAIDADVEGSSEDSRVKLKTFGHHDIGDKDEDDDEPNLFDLTVDSPAEAVAGSDVTIRINAQAVDSQISAFQINPAEQADHVNDFSNLSVTTTAETQIEEPGFVVYSTLQDEVTVEWTGTIPETAEAGETFTLAGDALNEAQDRQLFSHTVTVTDDPLEKYRNENGEIDDTGLLEAISDWRDDELEDTQLLELIGEWRDAGGNVETLSTALPNVM